MFRPIVRAFPPLTLALLGGACASRPEPIAIVVAQPAPAPVVVAAPMPPGASPGMRIPALLADGGYATPNRRLSADAALWHLRSGLNVAVLACRGPNEAVTVARYNALLQSHRAGLAAAQARHQAEYRAADPGDWQDRYDDAMTRLYNYWSQAPARADFCATADAVLAEIAGVAPDRLAAFAVARLPELDRPFIDFYRAYDAWQGRRAPVMMAALVTPAPGSLPRIEVDPAVFELP